LFSLKQNEAERPSRNAAQHRMNPTGPIGPRSIGAFAFVVGLVLKGDLHGPARRVMPTAIRLRSPLPLVGEAGRIAARRYIEAILLLYGSPLNWDGSSVEEKAS
jgi:hypothetical protein